MIVCENCSYENSDGVLICQRCDMPLGAAATGFLTARVAETQKRIGASQPGAGTQLISEGGRLVFQYRSMTVADLNVKTDQRITVGRVDRLTKEIPTINMSGIGGWENGISRLHVAIEHRADRLVVIDQDSTNGTYINGQRLVPYKTYPLSHGDVLKLGLLTIGVNFLSAERPMPINYEDHKMMLLVTSG